MIEEYFISNAILDNISGDYSIFRLTSINETISDGLVGLNRLEELNVLGGLNQEMQVIIDDAKLMEYGFN